MNPFEMLLFPDDPDLRWQALTPVPFASLNVNIEQLIGEF
jgi:hypothetical protein